MSSQFVHLQAFSRKGDSKGRSTSFVINEARRDPGASVHVANPSPPVLVFGVGMDEVERLHDAAADAATTTPKGGKPRRIQRTQHTLMTVVASHPHTMDEVRGDPDKRREAEEWEKRTVAWLRSQYGDKLVSVIRHEDESHYHLHAYVLPDDAAMRAAALHPGQTAKAAFMAAWPADGEDSKTLNKRGDAAYKAAMREWQNAYHEAVAIPCGLTRLGPQRRRLSRAEWQAEQTQAKALKTTIERAQTVKAKIDTHIGAKRAEVETLVSSAETAAAALRAEADAAKAEAARQIAAAKVAREAALKAQDKAVKEQAKARGMMSRVRQEAARVQAAAARLQRLPGVLRSAWDGFRKSAIEARIRRSLDSEMDSLRQQAAAADDRASAANDGRRQAEERARDLRENLTEAGQRLAAARRELAFLRPPELQREQTPGMSPGLRRPGTRTSKNP
ncbi:plasmid recombination protein [Rhizobium sp. CNPSo 3464]|uniref:plasmid recombination protein n=1 Tax=Rhizobium sp. CNPSo 3464 TaxID=3021406 RepID=UPI00254ECDC1|nr:plasmid recombination protein [Rhizobium sp. CNPSo 3464]MDK4739415.1 plasmid recombination protein [Rhizobium sp. CNPSo 3464]